MLECNSVKVLGEDRNLLLLKSENVPFSLFTIHRTCKQKTFYAKHFEWMECRQRGKTVLAGNFCQTTAGPRNGNKNTNMINYPTFNRYLTNNEEKLNLINNWRGHGVKNECLCAVYNILPINCAIALPGGGLPYITYKDARRNFQKQPLKVTSLVVVPANFIPQKLPRKFLFILK